MGSETTTSSFSRSWLFLARLERGCWRRIQAKRDQQATYIFAVAMRNRPATATFTCSQPTATIADVLGENRTLKLTKGVFIDEFGPYAFHLYRLR